jgi:hypothetical protein
MGSLPAFRFLSKNISTSVVELEGIAAPCSEGEAGVKAGVKLGLNLELKLVPSWG